jgi:hypothetical protein
MRHIARKEQDPELRELARSLLKRGRNPE